MKKGFLVFLLLGIVAVFYSCNSDDDAPLLGAKIEVAVKNSSGIRQKNIKVYMFKNLEPDDSVDPRLAPRMETTDVRGIASFKLNLAELSLTESDTNLYFAVFYEAGDDLILKAGDGSLIVKRNEEKDISIVIPI